MVTSYIRQVKHINLTLFIELDNIIELVGSSLKSGDLCRMFVHKLLWLLINEAYNFSIISSISIFGSLSQLPYPPTYSSITY